MFLRNLLTWPLRTAARLTIEGGLFFTLAAFCALFSLGSGRWSNVPLLLSAMLLMLGLLAMWQGTRTVRAIRVRRSHPEWTFAGESVRVWLHLFNASWLPAAGLVVTEELEPEDHGQPGVARALTRPVQAALPLAARETALRLPAARAATLVMALPGRGRERLGYGVTLRRRGIYQFGATKIETEFPFGFFRSSASRQSSGRLAVYPRLGEVNTTVFEELEVALQRMRRARPSRSEDEFRGLREFQKEDNPRWIHWRSSARLQQLMVRQFEEPQSKRVLLLLDTNLQRLGPRRGLAFETAISFAGTVARDLARRGLECEFTALQPGGRVERVTISRERRNLDVLLEILAALRRDDTRGLSDLRTQLQRHSLHNAYVLAVGLGSLRAKPDLSWLSAGDNVVRVLDARGEEFRQIFRRASAGSVREDTAEEDALLGLVEEEEEGVVQ